MNCDNNMQCSAQDVCDDLLSLLSFYKSQMAKVAEEHGLTIMQLHALRIVSEGGSTMSTMAKVMHCDASNVTGIVDRLLALSLVTRRESQNDRRVKTVELTDNGTTLLETITDELPTRLGCTQLNQAELNNLHNAIGQLTA